MNPTNSELAAARQWADAFAGETPPFSFTYGGRSSSETLPGWERTHAQTGEDEVAVAEVSTFTDPETGLSVCAEVTVHSDFAAVEWVLHLKNTGTADTPIIEGIQALDSALPSPPEQPVTLHYSRGGLCSRRDFEPLERRFAPGGSLSLVPGWGRSSSEILPFFNLQTGDQGCVLAIGWTGQWEAGFDRDEDGSMGMRAGMELTRLTLRPGEEIRTPRILLLFWQGERLRGNNMLRRFILAHHRPMVDGEPVLGPLCCGSWGGTAASVHLDNIRRITEENLPFEYYWIDAEWFGGPGPWMAHAGDWTPRADLYPEGFKPISDALHASGRKLLVWFEPERVAPGTPWASEHADWLLEVPPDQAVRWADYGGHMDEAEWVQWESRRNQLGAGDRLFNLGDPAARRFLTDFLSEKITEFGLDCFRQDSNIAQLAYWRNADEPDRQGITEIRYVEGQYALWDELLARHPGLIIDNCASGGRRIDLESLGRTTPLYRSDYTVGHGDLTALQGHAYGIQSWVPLSGTECGPLEDCDAYRLRSVMTAAMLGTLSGHASSTQAEGVEDYPFDHVLDVLGEYLWVREYYTGDYYPLTEYTLAEDAWMAYQLDLPETGEGLIVVLKRPQSPFVTASFPLHGLDPAADYALIDLDVGETVVLGGDELLEDGLQVDLVERPDSALITYRIER